MATVNNDVLVGKVFNFISNKGFLTFSDLLTKPSPLATKFSTKDAAAWIRDNLSRDRRFEVQESHASGKIISVKIVCKGRMCLRYLKQGKCVLDGCKYWHVCKEYIEGNCEKMCRNGLSHDFHDKENGAQTAMHGFGKLVNGTIRRIVTFNLPKVCSTYIESSCDDKNCAYLHICPGLVKSTCLLPPECNKSHNLRSGHNKFVLKRHGFDPCLEEKYVLGNVLLPKREVAQKNPQESTKTAEEENMASKRPNIGGKLLGATCESDTASAGKLRFKSQAGSQQQESLKSATHSFHVNVLSSSDEEEEISSNEDNESVDIGESCALNIGGSENKEGKKPKFKKRKHNIKKKGNSQLHRHKALSQSEGKSLLTQGLPTPPAKKSTLANQPSACNQPVSTVQEKLPDKGGLPKNTLPQKPGSSQEFPPKQAELPSAHRSRKSSEEFRGTSQNINAEKSSVSSKIEPVQISEKRVFESICKEFDCSVKLSDISGRADLFPNGKADAEAWFRKDARKNSFIITEGDNKEILEITAFSSKLRLCFNGGNCEKEKCGFFHVCRDFIAGCCKSGATCRHEHEFRNGKDKELISSLKIFNSFTEEQLGRIFRASAPHVCLDYNAGKCQKGKNCSKIHVCKDFVRKRCRAACSLDHDDAYETPHTKALAEKFRMSVLTLKRVIIVPQPPQGQLTDPGHVHLDGAVHICSDFILGQCRNGSRCAKHHCTLPYQWQYRSQEGVDKTWQSLSNMDNTWITCDEKDNESLERNYCDPSNGDNIKMNFNKTPFHTAGVCKMVVDFEKMTMLWPPLSHCPIEMRRLSTESSVLNSDNHLATTWTWYWQDADSLWEKYGSQSGSEREVQRRIEAVFLDPSNHWYDYRTSEHPYVLYFRDKSKGMYQKNQRYDTERKIRRRPEFRSTDEIEQLKNKRQHRKSSQSPQTSDEQHPGLPSHWSRMSQGKEFERVTLPPNSQEFAEVKRLFHRTMSEEEKIIIKIERVQNPYMWDKFARKKQNMKAKFYGSNLEKELFHGTDPGDVEKICKQNFDWRLHGKNASVYGQGSYFALNASYSDSYAGRADHNSSQFMFLANVLVGSYVKGDSTMRRPPPWDPSDPTSDLYDSCVDDENKPRIFVVFEMDQCYPSYVIEYVDIFQDYGVALSPSLYTGASRSGTHSTSRWSAAGVRAASPSSAVQTTFSVGTSSRSPFSSSSGYQSAASYGRTASSPSSATSNIQTNLNPSSRSSGYQSPTSYGAQSRAATSSLARASSVPSSRAAASPTTRDSWPPGYGQSLDDYAWPASQGSSSRDQGSSYGRSTSPTQGNGASSSKKEAGCVVS